MSKSIFSVDVSFFSKHEYFVNYILFIIETIDSDNEYISDDNSSDYIDEILCYQELSHAEIIEKCNFNNSHISDA